MIGLKENKDIPILIKFVSDLYPIYTCFIAPRVNETLKHLKKIHSELNIKKIKSVAKVFDCLVPDEWHVKNAYITDINGNTIVDFKNNNIHLVGNSISQMRSLSL